jgi:hypothetical protein
VKKMAPKPLATPQAVGDQGAVKKAKYARFFWPILRGIVLILALCAFIPTLSVFLYDRFAPIGFSVFFLASFALIAMTPRPETLRAIEGAATEKARQHRLPWSLFAYCVITGLGFNWACVFLWFSRRYAFFSAPVVGMTGLILAFYAAIALLVARLTGGNWRKALLVSAVAQGVLAMIVLRWGLLR